MILLVNSIPNDVVVLLSDHFVLVCHDPFLVGVVKMSFRGYNYNNST